MKSISLSYGNTMRMMDCCFRTFKKKSELSVKEYEDTINDYIESHQGNIMITYKADDSKKLSFAEELIICEAYFQEMFNHTAQFSRKMLRIHKTFFLMPFCDLKGDKLKQLNDVIKDMQNIYTGTASKESVRSLAEFFNTLSATMRDVKIRMIAGIVVYADILIMLTRYILLN